MKASIVISTYKRNSLLIKAIDSCLKQDFNDSFEIIVVDDNGLNSIYQEDNRNILSDLINSNQIIYFPLTHNMGACIARNKGADIANGEYLFFLDDDDEFLPNKLSEQISFLEANSKFNAHASSFLKKRDDKDFPATDGFPIIGDFKSFFMYGNIYTPMLCFRKADFLSVGGFAEIPKFQDMYFLCLCLERGLKIYADTNPLFVQNDHAGERISNKSVNNAHIAVAKLEELALKHRDAFNDAEWTAVNIRLTLLLATTYYSSTYLNRLKSIKYWSKCFSYSRDKKHLIPIIKSFLPNRFIKALEKRKSLLQK